MQSLLSLIIFAHFLLISSLSFDDTAGTVSLSISQGELLGKRIDSYDNRTGYGFLGVPFGAPAAGSLRFAKPIAAPSWKGVRNVTVKGDACPAGVLTYKRPESGPMSEDCLHAYVYSSKNCLTKGGCAIMWVLHGGRYNFESPVVFIDDVIVHNFASDGQDVVVIIPAYRLMNFGFLNIAPGMKTSAPPNVAVWDILLAMQWTHREAHHFGGDPMKITLFGHSAGAQFADVISTSPHFNGLFRSIVMMSGADTFYDANIKTNNQASWMTAKLLGCATNSTDQSDAAVAEGVIVCMREKTWEEIVEANQVFDTSPEMYLGPHADGPGGILPLSPMYLSSNRTPVSVMLGTTSAEFHETKYVLNADRTADLDKVAELCEVFAYGIAYANPLVMTKRCLDYYMQGVNVMDFEADTTYFMTTLKTAMEFAKKGKNVYLYSFTYKGVGNAFTTYLNLEEEDRPSHSEDYVYILGMHRSNFTKKDYEIEKIYSGMVLNFVKTGYPHPGAGQPKWKPINKMGRNYYEIDFDQYNSMPGMKRGYNAASMKLWVDDAEKYGGPITPPDEFPAHVDRFYPMNVVADYLSFHMNITDNGMYKSWIDYTNDRRLKYLLGLKSYRSIEFEEQDVKSLAVSDLNIIVEIIVICLSIVLIFFILQCCLHYVRVNHEKRCYERL